MSTSSTAFVLLFYGTFTRTWPQGHHQLPTLAYVSKKREKKNNKMNNTVKNGINEVRLRDRLKLLDYVWEARKTF